MSKRPRNECMECGYTWFPRGSNLSRKCPNCGVVFSDGGAASSPRGGGALPAVAAAGCLGLVAIIAVCGGCLALVRQPGDGRHVIPREAWRGGR